MRASVRFALLLAPVLAVILILLVTSTSPVIYSLQQDTFPSRFHNNTDALKRQSLNSTEDLMPLMEELSGYGGPIILNVRLNDPEQARRDLELFAKNRVAFSNLVVKLDMTESEMQEYSKSRTLQNQLLSELVNSSISLDELKKLEIQYRNSDNPTMLMSVQLEGEALNARIQELYDRYEEESRKTITIEKKLGIDTTRDEENVVSFKEYVDEIAPSQQSPIEIPPRRTNLLTLLLLPDHVRYGDTFSCSGSLLSPLGVRYAGIPDRNVTIYIDDEPVSASGTGSSGEFTARIPVERIAAGTHTVHAASGQTLSETRTLEIGWADSSTTLELGQPGRNREVAAAGSVSAGVPVRGGEVEIIVDGTVARSVDTDAKGQFRTMLSLSPGTHTIVARFTGKGLPVRPSESEPVVIELPEPGVPIIRSILPEETPDILPAISVAITLILFICGALYYLLRKQGQGTVSALLGRLMGNRDGTVPPVEEPSPEIPLPEMPPADGTPDIPATDIPGTLFSRYLKILQEDGISEAAFVMYRNFSRRIADDQQIRGYTSLTPLEMSRSCRNRPYCGTFARFVSVYEVVRYGGVKTGTVRAEFEAVLQHTEKQIGGDDPAE